LSVSFPFSPVRPDAAGGAEQVLGSIDRGLVRDGHRSVVIGPEGSRISGELIATPGVKTTIDTRAWQSAHDAYRREIAKALQTSPVDVVHMHGLDFRSYLPAAPVPTIATLHLPIDWYDASLFRAPPPNLTLTCVSNAQRRRVPPDALPVDVIPNGVPLSDRPWREMARRRFVLALSRICPEKGVHLALSAAQRARIPLILAGCVSSFDTHQRYYRETIAPRLDDTRRFIGPVGPRRKRRLLSAARCLLVPSLAPETSSLVTMEATIPESERLRAASICASGSAPSCETILLPYVPSWTSRGFKLPRCRAATLRWSYGSTKSRSVRHSHRIVPTSARAARISWG